jgi:2',3'-cyclic-nucleotide 2'-phosphodiesterase (5'-nucleotidase family)
MFNFFKDYRKKIKILTLNDTYQTNYYGKWAQKVDEIISAEKDPNTIFVKIFGGDFLFTSKYSKVLQGHDMILASNACNFDAIGIGNHEFDGGKLVLAELAQMSNSPLLCSNLDKKTVNELNLKRNFHFVKNNIKFGVVAYIGQDTPQKTTGAKDLVFYNLRYLFRTQKKFLLSCDVRILIFHDNIDIIIEFLNLNPKYKYLVDAIVTGDQHIVYAGYIQREDYKIPIVQMGSDATGVGYIEIKYDTFYKCPIKSFVEVIPIPLVYPETSEIGVLTKWVEEISAPYFSKTIGIVKDYPLDGTRPNVRIKETNLGDLLTDAYLSTGLSIITAQEGNIFAITNGGSIRNESLIPIGTEINGIVLNTIIPFPNNVVALEIIGRTNVNLLINYLATTSLSKQGFGGWLQISNNLLFDYVTNKYDLVGGTSGETDKFYLICTNFTAAGGDGYTELTKYKLINIDLPTQTSLENYIENNLNGIVSYPISGNRIILS